MSNPHRAIYTSVTVRRSVLLTQLLIQLRAITTIEYAKRPVGGAWLLHPARVTLANKNLRA